MISYANVPVTPQPGAVEAVAAWWHGHRIDDFEFQGYFLPGIQHLPLAYHPRREEPRLGVLHWPVAADRFATCYLAVDGATKTKITTAVATAGGLGELAINDGAGGVVSTAMYLVATHPISTRSGTDYHLLVLADARYFWWQTGADEISGGATWAALFTSLFSIIGAGNTVSTVPSAYLTPNPARWDVGVQPVPPVLQAAAMTVGLRPAVQLDGSVLVQSYTTALAADDARWLLIRYECLAGGQIPGTDIARGLPASVDTSFFDGTSTTTTLASLSITLAGGQAGVVATKGLVVADPAAPTASEKTAYAAQAASDYYSWAFSRTDCTLRGAVNVVPNGLDEAVEWINTTDTVLTRIIRPPLFDRNLYGSPYSDTPTGRAASLQDALASCSWLSGLADTDCLELTVVSASGLCSAIDTEQVVYLAWDVTDSRWESTSDFTSDAGAGAVNFTDATPPTLTIGGTSGRYWGCDGTDGLLFSFGKSPLCTAGTPVLCDNSFVVRITCSCCPIDGWAGADWYCVRESGTGDPAEPQYLEDADKCDTTVEIVSGPYATEAAALAACGPPPSCTDRDPSTLPTTLDALITASLGGTAACANGGTFVMTEGTPDEWNGSQPAGCDSANDFNLACVGGAYTLSAVTSFGSCGGDTGPWTAVTGVATPFSLTFQIPACMFDSAGGTDLVTITITE